jgi:presequence protease
MLQVEHLVLETLQAARKAGFSPSAVDAALNTIEFSLRENNTGRFPRGIAMMLRAMGAWVYDRDPYECALACCRASGLMAE